MDNIVFKCDFCDKVFIKDCYRKQHQKFCVNNKNRDNNIKELNSSRKQFSKKENMYIKQNFTCEFCNKNFYTMKFAFTRHKLHCINNPNRTEDPSAKKGSHISDETRRKLKENAGGYSKRAGRGKRGYYKGLYCMSTWELAWVVYQIEHGQQVEQCEERFPYIMENVEHYYIPDFKINGVYYEIKNWHRPDTDFKINQFPKDKTLILVEGKKQNQMYLDYVESKYGKNFWEVLYE